MGVRDGYARTYPPGDILRLVREWWPQGFGDMSTEQLRSLLDELGGLGVLVRNADGHSRLRSPNLVRLMGTEGDIENRLLELSQREPPSLFDADSHHTPLDPAAQYYSPLSYAQERSLMPPQFGVGLIFASEALGFAQLPRTVKHFLAGNWSESPALCTEIPAAMTDGEQLLAWLDQYLQTHERHEHLIAYQRPADSACGNLASLVRVALHFCTRHQSRKRWMRVLFLCDPPATWTWLALPQKQREELENRPDAVVFPHRWNLIGIRQRLAQHDKLHSDEVCQSVLRATGGWTLLLDTLFERCGSQDDPRPAAQTIEREIAEPASVFCQQFRGALGLEMHAAVGRVLDFVRHEDHIPVEVITPEWIGGEPALDRKACTAAVEYLQRMNCIALVGDMVSVETTVGGVFAPL
jgi:hypothetical protein